MMFCSVDLVFGLERLILYVCLYVFIIIIIMIYGFIHLGFLRLLQLDPATQLSSLVITPQVYK